MGLVVVPRVLQEKLGEEGSDAFVKVIKEIDLEARKEALVIAEERFEVKLVVEMDKLRQEMNKFKEEMRQEMNEFKEEIHQEMNEFKEEMRQEMNEFKEEIHQEINGFKKEMHQEMSGFKEEMHQEISSLRVENVKSKADMIKWMFIFWIGQIGVLSGIIYAFMKAFSG